MTEPIDKTPINIEAEAQGLDWVLTTYNHPAKPKNFPSSVSTPRREEDQS